MKTVQTDADNTIYRGNLLVSLGWIYLGYLFKQGKYLKFLDRLIELAFFYFISSVPRFIFTAFIPFRGCPIELADKVNNRLNKRWLKKIKEIKPKRIIIVTHQDKTLIERYIRKKGIPGRFKIVSNRMEIKKGRFTGKAKVRITYLTKYDYVKRDILYIGDFKDYTYYGRKSRNFSLV
jgi:hypothetical protein